MIKILAGNLVKFGSEAWKNNVLNSLGIMWKGVLAIAIVIAVVILTVILLNKLTARRKTRNEEGEKGEEKP